MKQAPSRNRLKYPPWQLVEKQIQREINWLRNSIETFSSEEKYAPISCQGCLMRKIATLIVSGKVRATEITKGRRLQSFWGEKTQSARRVYHGKDWHRKSMEQVENHFVLQGFKVVREPSLYWGRADLGVYKHGVSNLFIEVGTTSLFKLWINLYRMKNFIYLIVPSDNRLIEFVCGDS